MSLFKKKLTEQEAAAHFVLHVMTESQNIWPETHKLLKETFKEKFVVEDETMAAFDFALAAIAQSLQPINNLFPKDQAKRVEQYVFECIDTEDYGEYAKDEVRKYSEAFKESVKTIEIGGNTLEVISVRLLHRMLGEKIRNFEVKISEEEAGVISPLLVMAITNVLISFAGTWKHIKDNFKLIEGDLSQKTNI
jgi:hypothetical protein